MPASSSRVPKETRNQYQNRTTASESRTASDDDDSQFIDANSEQPGSDAMPDPHEDDVDDSNDSSSVPGTEGIFLQSLRLYTNDTTKAKKRFRVLLNDFNLLPVVSKEQDTFLFVEKLDTLVATYPEFQWLFTVPAEELDDDQFQFSCEAASVIKSKVLQLPMDEWDTKNTSDVLYARLRELVPGLEFSTPESPVPVILPSRRREETISQFLIHVGRWIRRYSPSPTDRGIINVLAAFMWHCHWAKFSPQLKTLGGEWERAFPHFQSTSDVLTWFRKQQLLRDALSKKSDQPNNSQKNNSSNSNRGRDNNSRSQKNNNQANPPKTPKPQSSSEIKGANQSSSKSSQPKGGSA